MMVLASLPCFQTLIDTKRSETIAEATEPPSSADEVSGRRRGGYGGGGDSRQSTLSRHASMDNLQRSSPTRAGQYARQPQPSPKYTSMMNLNTSHGREHESLKTLKRSKKREAPTTPAPKPPVAAKPPIAAGMSTAAQKRATAKTTAPPNPPPARDASLQFLGRMSPEEQLNKFLKSVEEVNAENLGRLRRRKDKGDARASSLTDNSSSSGAEAALKRMTGPVLHSRARAMRRESSRRDSRWHSMDNLSNMKQTLKQQLQQQHLLHTPARSKKPLTLHSTTSSNSSRDKAAHPQTAAAGGEGTPAKPSRRKRQESPLSPKAVGFREVNGPSKAFSSMSQLDTLRGNHDSVRFSDPISSSSGTSTKKRNSRCSPMETTSSSSHSRTASSTEMDANGNRKSSKSRVAEISPPPPMPPAQPMPTSSAIVSYLGSIALNSQASDLTSLQLPLKELYYKYMSNEVQPLSNSRLDITDTGLRVLYKQGPSGRQAEIFNPFPSIAVWAAVRFVYKRASTNEPGKFLFAFLPLISDPGDTEKNQLYTALSKKDVKLAVSNEHPAMFACIMRRMGSSRKQLECHGFVCDSKEDAIMIAANLYRSLMETMKRQQELEEEGAMTSASSATFWSDQTPSRPPRKRKSKSKTSSKNSRSHSMDDATSQMDTAVDEDLQQTSTMRRKKSLGRSHSAKVSDHGDSYKRRVKRSASERRSVADEDEDQEELSEGETGTVRKRRPGDIYTKVAMPRSKSFMNVSGPYNLQELFKELKDKEGIESVDDILRQVISREGMSFNRTSPMYRELLMKLAMSLSADEMFIRSKNIMMQEKSKSVNREESSAFARVFGGIFGRNKNKQSNPNLAGPKVNKADIGGPLPVSEEARRELTKQWMKVTPQLAELTTVQQQLKSAKSVVSAATTATSSGSSGNNNKVKAASAANNNNNNSHSHNNRNKPRSRSREAASCSECGGYQSTSQFSYSVCSCSLTTTAVDTMINSDDDGESTAPSSASAMK